MSKLKKCLNKFEGLFSDRERGILLSRYDSFVKKNDSDLNASTKAVLVLHRDLFEELNKLKKAAGQKIDEAYVAPSTQEAVAEVYRKYEELEEIEESADKPEVKDKKDEVRDKANRLKNLIDVYNSYSLRDRKKPELKVLYDQIQDALENDPDFEVRLGDDSKLFLYKRDSNVRVKRGGKRRSYEELEAERADEQLKKTVLNYTPVNTRMAILQLVARGYKFNIGQLKPGIGRADLTDLPSLLKTNDRPRDNPNVVDLEDLAPVYRSMDLPVPPGMDGPMMWDEASGFISMFIGDDSFRQTAIDENEQPRSNRWSAKQPNQLLDNGCTELAWQFLIVLLVSKLQNEELPR